MPKVNEQSLTKILRPIGLIKKLSEEFNYSPVSVRKALDGACQSKKAKEVRKRALEIGAAELKSK